MGRFPTSVTEDSTLLAIINAKDSCCDEPDAVLQSEHARQNLAQIADEEGRKKYSWPLKCALTYRLTRKCIVESAMVTLDAIIALVEGNVGQNKDS
jgi:hypothetical protein